ncbi:MAG: class I SAM-dependent methyltransferase [Chitinophagaceae bacterium]
MSDVKAFYNNFDNRLLTDFVNDNPRVMSALDFVGSYLTKMKPKQVLDIGCGIGWSSFEVSHKFPDCQVLGVDLSDNLIAIAGKLFSSPNLKFSSRDLTEEFELSGNANDVVIMIDVFEHIPATHREAFFGKLLATLDKEFSVLLTCPTKKHQEYLRLHKPEGLQPVDEDVDFEVVQGFAKALGAEVVYFANKDIWCTNDYLHAIISNKIPYKGIEQNKKPFSLLTKNQKLALLKEKGIPVPENGGVGGSILKRLINRLR